MDKSQQQLSLRPPQRRKPKKTVEATGGLVGNKIVEKVTKTATKNNCEDPRKYTIAQILQPTSIPQEIYITQKSYRKFLMNLMNFYNYKYRERMEYQKIINLLGNTNNQSSKFRVKNWVELNDDAHGTYNTNSQIKFKTTMLKSSIYDYSDAYILIKRAITGYNVAQG